MRNKTLLLDADRNECNRSMEGIVDSDHSFTARSYVSLSRQIQ
jgi:hypothetical protein